jgi:hypothetical protein
VRTAIVQLCASRKLSTEEERMKRWAISIVALLIPAAAWARPADKEVRIDPHADRELRRMSDYVSGLKSFRVHAMSSEDLVSSEGQKIQRLAEQEIQLKRPNKLRTDRRDPRMDAVFRYDGHQLSVYGKRTGYFATASAPSDLDDFIENARAQYGVEAPAADLLGDSPYDTLMEDVVVGRYIGLESIGGVPVHHLAYQGKDVDFQIWIQDGPKPLPLRYSITSKREPAAPEFNINLDRWEPNAVIPDRVFAFTPPPGAHRIAFMPTAKSRANR